MTIVVMVYCTVATTTTMVSKELAMSRMVTMAMSVFSDEA